MEFCSAEKKERQKKHPSPEKGIFINDMNVGGVDDIATLRKNIMAGGKIKEGTLGVEIVDPNPPKIKCRHYNYPYSNCVTFALGEEKSNLDFHMRSRSMLFSLLKKEYYEIDQAEASPGDIVVYYYRDEEDPNTAEGDHTYEHVGKMIEDGKVLSQWGNCGVFRHLITAVGKYFGDSVVFMRRKGKKNI